MTTCKKFKNITVIDISEWDTLVQSTYSRPYNFQQQDGCKPRGTVAFTVPVAAPDDYENSTVPEVVNDPNMGVSFAAWLARDTLTPIPNNYPWALDIWWERNFYPNVDMIINDLYSKELIEAGEYMINIDW